MGSWDSASALDSNYLRYLVSREIHAAVVSFLAQDLA